MKNLKILCKMAQKFNPIEGISALNTIRMQFSNTPFTSSMLRDEFKLHKIPSNSLFWAVFCTSGLLQRLDVDLFCFTNVNKPIHISYLDNIYNEYRNRSNRYIQKYRVSHKKQNLLEREDVQNAIKLLTSCGFRVVIENL